MRRPITDGVDGALRSAHIDEEEAEMFDPVERRDHDHRGARLPLAVDKAGREISWYPNRHSHVLLTGSAGSGKTSTARTLMGQITQHGWPVWVLDARRVEFLDFRTWPNVQIVASKVEEQVALVHRAWERMENRYQLIEAGKYSQDDFKPLVVVLDDLATFRRNLFEWYAQVKEAKDPDAPPTLAEVAALIRMGRSARIHLVLSAPRPDTESLDGEMRSNFGFQISMGRLTTHGAMMMWGDPSVGVALPRNALGRATATDDNGNPIEVQCYHFPDINAEEGSEEWQLLQSIRPAEARWPRLVIVPPEAQVDIDGGEPSPPTFRDYARAVWDLATNRPDLCPDRRVQAELTGADDQQ